MAHTAWHITWGTYGARLHGGERPTVERPHNNPGEAFVAPDPALERAARTRMVAPPVRLTQAQRTWIESQVPVLCERGRWTFEACAAAPDHVHTLLRAQSVVHGKQIRTILKRWLTQSLNQRWTTPARWWADGRSTKPVPDDAYLRSATRYIERQQTLPVGSLGARPGDGAARK